MSETGRRNLWRVGPTFLVLLLVASTANGTGDRSHDPSFAGGSLSAALQKVQDLGLRLVYSSRVVTSEMGVEQEPASTDPRRILEELLAPHGLQAREGPGGVLFIVKEDNGPAEAGGIRGVVRRASDGTPVRGVRIQVEGTRFAAIARRDGSFRIGRLPSGSYDLVVSAPGIQPERFEAVAVRPGRPTWVTLNLAAAPSMLERVVVSTGPEPTGTVSPSGGRTMEGESFRMTPSLGGDVQRVVAESPGNASGDRSAEFSVRGGEPNEVLVVLDGQELYDPFHLKDFQRLSGIIDPAAVGSAQFYSEGFPAEYGDRMSGVLDVVSAIPSANGSTLISSNFLNSRIRSDGRFLGGAGHWLVAARTWYPDAVVETTSRAGEGFRPVYYDWLAKAQIQLGGRTILTGHLLAARDDVEFTDPEGEESVTAESGNRYAWLTVDSLWSDRLAARTRLSHGQTHSIRIGHVDEDGEFVAGVDDDRTLRVIGLAQDWTFRASDRLLVKWGVSGKSLESAYEYSSQEAGAESASVIDRIVSGRQLGAYVAPQFQPVDGLTLEAGLRWDRQTYTGEAQTSPRLSLAYAPGGSDRIRAGWGHYYQSQGLHELPIEDGVTEFSPAQHAEHWFLGYEHAFSPRLRLRADATWKRMSRLRPRYENLFNPFELLPEFEPDRVEIDPERAEAKGLDLSLMVGPGGSFDGWAAYSFATTEDVVDGREVPRSWDQPHAFRFGLHYRRQETWEAGLTGEYHSGWPTTPVTARSVEEPDGSTTLETVPGARNSGRLPDYHRLDLRVARHFRFGRGRLSLFAEVTNLLDRENICCVEDFRLSPRADGSVRIEEEYGTWLQRVPSFGVTWQFDH